jgi:hypothetical protein
MKPDRQRQIRDLRPVARQQVVAVDAPPIGREAPAALVNDAESFAITVMARLER